jgi:Peptidase family M23
MKKTISYYLRLIPLFIMLITAIALLLMFLSGGIAKIYAWYLVQIILPVIGLVGLVFTIVRLIIRKRFDRVVTLTGVTSLLAIFPALMLVFPQPYPASLKHTSPSATVRLPAEVPLKVAWGGDNMKVNQHVIVPDQRWAYDFLIEPYLTGSSVLTDYGCYGVPVVAPASGLVSTAHDGEPDMAPGKTSNNYKAPSGNHVVIRLDETGTYLEIAHLQQGSVTVTTGQRVEEGQLIGQCGNSGNTSEPHIHIHHQRQDPSVYPINFAEGLPLYFKDLDGPPMPEGGFQIVNGTPEATGATVVHHKSP